MIDVGGLKTVEQKMTMASAALRALWEAHTAAPEPEADGTPGKRESRLIVIDEAHNVCVDAPTGPIERRSTEHVVRIAAEGRKYGLNLLMATQRPNKVHANALSQCENLFLMRMNSSDDLDLLRRIFSRIPPDVIRRARSFGKGEALISGGVVPAR